MRSVWAYWQPTKSRDKPEMIKMCHQRMANRQRDGVGYNLNILSEDNLNIFFKNIPDIFFKFPWYCSGAFQADYLRVRLLYEYGGVYLDSDTLVLGSLDPFFSLLEEYDSVFFRAPDGFITNAVLISKPKSQIMGDWLEEIEGILERAPTEPNDQGGILPCAWGGLGQNSISPLVNSEKYKNIKVFSGEETIYPINWSNQEVLLQDDSDKLLYNKYKRDMQPVLILTKVLYEAIERQKISLEELRNSGRLISNFINAKS